MTKHECRMTKEIQMTNDEHAQQEGRRRSLLVFRDGFDIRHFDFVIHSSFVIRHSSLPS